MKKLFALFFFGLLILQQVSAQTEAPNGPLDLNTCVAIAIENNLTLKRSELNQMITEANLLESQGRRLPSLTAGASSGYRWGRSINPVTNLFETRRIGNIQPTQIIKRSTDGPWHHIGRSTYGNIKANRKLELMAIQLHFFVSVWDRNFGRSR